MKKILVLFFVCAQISAQTITLKGNILDKENKEPVVYANVSFIKSNKGISSKEDGSFELEIKKELLKDKVHVSCLNYKDTVVLAKDIQNKTLFLSPKLYKLNEVVISKERNKKVVLDKVKKRVSPFHTNNIRMVGKYFPNKLDGVFYLENVKIFFSKRNSHKAKFRIRIFSVDENTGKPKEDILKENISISKEKGQNSVELNLDKYYLELPENGLFVVFEKLLIPYNLYVWDTFKNKEKQHYYAPVIGLTKSKEYKETNRIYYFSKGNWYKIPMPENDFSHVPAISVTLTN